MDKFVIKHNELTADEFVELWESVWTEPPTKKQTELALKNSIFRVSVFCENEIVGMARMIGDFGLCYYIKDVVVKPKFQRKGIGKLMIKELLKFINNNGVKGTDIFVELCAMPDKIPFYEKFGCTSNEAQRLRIFYTVK